MVLDDVVVDTILGFLDDDTLLTSRLVCQRWNKEITQRNGLWIGLMMCVALAKGSVDHLVQNIHFMQEGINMASGTKRYIQILYTVNYDWLEGLSPSNTKPDFPVAVTFSEEHPNGRCLCWSEGLWESISLPAEQKSEGASDHMAD
ncbi:hypothetical protein ACOMHN_004020 [Nucella lapillus]